MRPTTGRRQRGRAGVRRVEGEAGAGRGPRRGLGARGRAARRTPSHDRDVGRTGDREDAVDSRAAALDETARRLAIPDDPTVVSYLFSGIVQIESIRRQNLLEMDTTEERLAELARLLELEISLLERRLKNYEADPRLLALRRN